MEAGPVEVYRGDYAKAPVVTKSSDVVKNLLEKIKNKSEKYPEDRQYPLYLLIYTTRSRAGIGLRRPLYPPRGHFQ